MMVLLISRSTGKSQKTVRTILDSFAERIGDDAWRTVITSDGLEAVRTALRRNATKNTAVSCHWIRSRARSDLLWIVGDRSQFNDAGAVPVNTTKKKIIHSETTGSTCRLLKSWPVWRDFFTIGAKHRISFKRSCAQERKSGIRSVTNG